MSNRDSYIGVFDSGIGGLTVLKAITELMPNENIIYFGDTANLPYGTKSKSQIERFAMNDVAFLMEHDIKALVIACNTADAAASDKLRENFDIPIYGVIEPASKKASEISKKHIGVFATSATVKSESYQKKISKYRSDAVIEACACPLLVPLVENGRYEKDDEVVKLILEEYLSTLSEDVDTLVLGCTHYPLLQEAIESLRPNMNVISSSLASAEALKNSLEEKYLLSSVNKGERKYFVSDDAEHFKENAKIFFGEDLRDEVTLVNLSEKK